MIEALKQKSSRQPSKHLKMLNSWLLKNTNGVRSWWSIIFSVGSGEECQLGILFKWKQSKEILRETKPQKNLTPENTYYRKFSRIYLRQKENDHRQVRNLERKKQPRKGAENEGEYKQKQYKKAISHPVRT